MNLTRLNYGSVPGDHTGDILFDLFSAIESNFVALENIPDASGGGGIFAGTGDQDLKTALKFMAITEFSGTDLLFIDSFLAGHAESGQFRYTLVIKNAPTVDGESQDSTPWLTWTALVASKKAGWSRIVLQEDDGSGVFGVLVVDWDALSNTNIQPGNYKAGALCGITHITNWANNGDPDITDIPLIHITDDATINGISALYVVDGTKNITLTTEDIEFCRSTIKILNKMDGAYYCRIFNSGNDSGPLPLSILVNEGGTVTLHKDVDHFEPTGDFTPYNP